MADHTTTAVLRRERVNVQQPAAAHLSQGDDEREEISEREATELQNVFAAYQVVDKRIDQESRWTDPIKRFWKNNVRLSVLHAECRDHLANERTFLAYLRTSLALSMTGIAIAQLYRLQHSPTPDARFGYYVLSKPLAALFQCSAMLVLALGCMRFYRQQAAMARGRVHAGGWDLYVVMGSILLLLAGFFVLHLTVVIFKIIH